MNRDNTPVFQTKHSRIYHFNDFEKNVKKERDELEKVDRSFDKNEPGTDNLSNKSKYKFNKVTRKMDDLTKDEVSDKLDSMDDMGVEHTDHKFKIKGLNKNESLSQDNWDKLAENLYTEYGESLVDGGDENNPYDWWLQDMTVTDMIDFLKKYND